MLYKALQAMHRDMVMRMNFHNNITERNLLNFLKRLQLNKLSKQECQSTSLKDKWELEKKTKAKIDQVPGPAFWSQPQATLQA